jgi:hypothetical protein
MLKTGLRRTPRIQTSGTRAVLLSLLAADWWFDTRSEIAAANAVSVLG